MPLQFIETQIPSIVTWFNTFIGYSEFLKRAERVEARLRDIGIESDALNRRYMFHRVYKQVVTRNRTQRPINWQDPDTSRVLSMIAAARHASGILDERGRETLSSRFRDVLGPDRDFRELEHELRALVHYTQAECSIKFHEFETPGTFDFLVKNRRGEFDVECKTFAEHLGSPLNLESSVSVFSNFRSALKENPVSASGILNVEFDGRPELAKTNPREALSDFLRLKPQEKHYDDVVIRFDVRRDWDNLMSEGKAENITSEIAGNYVDSDYHLMVTANDTRFLLMLVSSRKRAAPVDAIVRRLKDAADQLSMQRPGLIWAHFNGLAENDFAELHRKQSSKNVNALELIANRVFKSESRKHLCKLRFSAVADRLRPKASTFLGSPVRAYSGGGPAYDFTSKVSTFDTNLVD